TSAMMELTKAFGKGEPENFDEILEIIEDPDFEPRVNNDKKTPKQRILETLVLIDGIIREYPHRQQEFLKNFCDQKIREITNEIKKGYYCKREKLISTKSVMLPLIPFYFQRGWDRDSFNIHADFEQLIPIFLQMTLGYLNIQAPKERPGSGDFTTQFKNEHYRKIIDDQIKLFTSYCVGNDWRSNRLSKERQVNFLPETKFCLRVLKELSQRQPKKGNVFVFEKTRKYFQTSLSYGLMTLL